MATMMQRVPFATDTSALTRDSISRKVEVLSQLYKMYLIDDKTFNAGLDELTEQAARVGAVIATVEGVLTVLKTNSVSFN